MVQPESRPRRSEQVLAQEVSGTAVLLHMADSQYYALDAVGSRVWALCDGTHTVAEIAAVIGEEYDAPVEQIEADVIDLLDDLAREKLVVEAA